MKRDDILKLAREQGLPETAAEGVFMVNTDDLGRMLAAEREACAKVCLWHNNTLTQNPTLFHMAELIRTRGQA